MKNWVLFVIAIAVVVVCVGGFMFFGQKYFLKSSSSSTSCYGEKDKVTDTTKNCCSGLVKTPAFSGVNSNGVAAISKEMICTKI
ncbi:MAG: hypothetical protein NTW50_04615 [Candidatus Berkelbacteria bacterium]|nr:hypothetical protein [Candidatus Berkelbacteria bacterium]